METIEREPSPLEHLLSILNETASEIRRLEAAAKLLLYTKGDEPGYREHIRHKAFLLSELAEQVDACVGLPLQVRTLVQERVGSFSFEAERALRLDSIFYMAVLLCPEDHREGEPNELERLIEALNQQKQ